MLWTWKRTSASVKRGSRSAGFPVHSACCANLRSLDVLVDGQVPWIMLEHNRLRSSGDIATRMVFIGSCEEEACGVPV